MRSYESKTVFDSVRIAEVYNLAKDFETEAVLFYDSVAGMAEDPAMKDAFRRLAAMESAHHDKFDVLGAGAMSLDGGATGGDPSVRSYLGSLIWLRSRKTSRTREEAERLIASKNARKVLEFSINLEKEAIVMYLGLEAMLVNQEARNVVNSIIGEEMSHIVILSDMLSR